MNVTTYVSIAADHAHHILVTVHHLPAGQNTVILIGEQDSDSVLGPVENSWDGTGDSHRGCAGTVQRFHVNMEQNVRGRFPAPCCIYALKD